MAQKIPVMVMVDPEHELIIKPFAAELAKAALIKKGDDQSVTGSATYTYNNGSHDGDGTID